MESVEREITIRKPNLFEDIAVIPIDIMGSDTRVANVARVSFHNWHNEVNVSDFTAKQDEKLIVYLAKHQHESPFGHVLLTMRMKAPIFVARQWFKSVVGVIRNETSRRYVADMPTYWRPDAWHARPDASIKQGSGDVHPESWMFNGLARHAASESSRIYESCLSSGLAPEEARLFLSQAMMTEWVETGSLLYYARVLGLRLDSHAQKSGTQELANKTLKVLRTYPQIRHSLEALLRYNPRRALAQMVENETARVNDDK